jgi:hypothetical protein
LLLANDPLDRRTPSAAALPIIRAGSDEQLALIWTQILAERLCGVDQKLQRWIYAGQTRMTPGGVTRWG